MRDAATRPTGRPAHPGDLAAVRQLVVAAGLPDAGLIDHFPGAYVVVQEAGAIIGTAGLEVHGESGLLRSLAVASSHRGMGLGRELTEADCGLRERADSATSSCSRPQRRGSSCTSGSSASLARARPLTCSGAPSSPAFVPRRPSAWSRGSGELRPFGEVRVLMDRRLRQ